MVDTLIVPAVLVVVTVGVGVVYWLLKKPPSGGIRRVSGATLLIVSFVLLLAAAATGSKELLMAAAVIAGAVWLGWSIAQAINEAEKHGKVPFASLWRMVRIVFVVALLLGLATTCLFGLVKLVKWFWYL